MSYATSYHYRSEPEVSAPALKIDRIDLIEKPEGVLVRKFQEGWTSNTIAKEAYMVDGATIEQLIARVRSIEVVCPNLAGRR